MTAAKPLTFRQIAILAHEQLDEARNALTPDSDAATHALVSIAASCYRLATSRAGAGIARTVPLDDYGIDPPESEHERYWREKDQQAEKL
jgi:hypothetical protein